MALDLSIIGLSDADIAITMALIFGFILIVLFLLNRTLEVLPGVTGNFLPLEKHNLMKREFEIFSLHYTVVWIALFGCVVVFKYYEEFDENSYMKVCVTLSLPFLLQPFLWPLPSEKNFPLVERYSFKANVWIAIFSFIGNYWYTHYFYSVLGAKYTFPAHRLNDVPIALFFATHFYFMTYHTFSNLMLRIIETRYASGTKRTIFFWATIFAFSYFTAYMETLTITPFPCYAFENRNFAFTVGSAFYGIYFIVSFPIFFQIDEYVGKLGVKSHTLYQTVLEAFGCSMIVLCLLDFGRLVAGKDLNIKGVAYYINENKCVF